MTDAAEVISVKGLSKYYGNHAAVVDLRLRVCAGKILALVGVNGAGKTTTLRCMAGIIPPSAGEITIAGHALVGDALAAKRKLCFVPDTPHLFDYLTVVEHLRFAARIHGIGDVESRITELLQRFELESKAHELPQALSRGMRQKVAICMAFLHDPRAILLDEPLTGLDPLGIASMKEAIIERARKHQAAVIVCSHQLEVLESLSDSIMIVDKGRCVVEGTLEDLRARVGAKSGELSLEEVFLRLKGVTPRRAVSV
ncbi:MAG: ABC transporter ATP-binding protein [Steroidobacteraceae bacterium]|nr:ABC transporter ATP-binding protein [Steroidobacteraceae bacterium]